MLMRVALLLVCACAAAHTTACITERESSPPGLDSAVVQRARAVQSWSIHERGARVGSVVRYEHVNEPERYFYMVRNRHDQDLGMIDALGRIFRQRPHSEEPEQIGSGSVLEGARRILRLGKRAELREMPVGTGIQRSEG